MLEAVCILPLILIELRRINEVEVFLRKNEVRADTDGRQTVVFRILQVHGRLRVATETLSKLVSQVC